MTKNMTSKLTLAIIGEVHKEDIQNTATAERPDMVIEIDTIGIKHPVPRTICKIFLDKKSIEHVPKQH